MENNNYTPPFELKLEHQLEYQPEAEDFTVDVYAKILRQGSCPLLEISFSSTVHDFIWEDEDCPEKVELYELLVDAGLIGDEAQFLLNDIILYVERKTPPLDQEYKGVFTLRVQVTVLPEPVELNQAGSEQTDQSQEPLVKAKTREPVRGGLKPKPKPKKQIARYKIGPDGVSLVLVNRGS